MAMRLTIQFVDLHRGVSLLAFEHWMLTRLVLLRDVLDCGHLQLQEIFMTWQAEAGTNHVRCSHDDSCEPRRPRTSHHLYTWRRRVVNFVKSNRQRTFQPITPCLDFQCHSLVRPPKKVLVLITENR